MYSRVYESLPELCGVPDISLDRLIKHTTVGNSASFQELLRLYERVGLFQRQSPHLLFECDGGIERHVVLSNFCLFRGILTELGKAVFGYYAEKQNWRCLGMQTSSAALA